MGIAGSGSDILWAASIDDLTKAFFDQFDKRIQNLESSAGDAFGRVEGQIKGAGTGIGVLSGLVSSLTTKMIELGYQAAAAIKQFVSTSIDLRARVDTLGVSLDTVGRNAGYTNVQLAEYEESIKSMGITTQAARVSLLQMAQANLDLSKASQLARVAQDAAVIAGINSSQAFERMLHGITTLQPEVLRMLGIVVNLQQEYDMWAKATNTAAKDMDYATKQVIMFNAALKAGEKITGTYESAMGSVGKQITSLPRYIEEIQLALGEAFQPVLSAKVGYMTDKLKELLKWLHENHDAVVEFSTKLGETADALFALLGRLVEFASTIPNKILEIGVAIAKLLSKIDDDEMQRRVDNMGTYFKQAITLIVGFFATGVSLILEVVGIALAALNVLIPSERSAADKLEEIRMRVETFGQSSDRVFTETTIGVGKFLGVVEDTDDATRELANSADYLTGRMWDMYDAFASVNTALDAMKDKMEEELSKNATEEMRNALRDELELSFDIEDIERQHLERLESIRKNNAKDRTSALQQALESDQQAQTSYYDDVLELEIDSARQRIDIETDYRRTLKDLQTSFEDDASELARGRDAVGLLRLQRKYTAELRDAKLNRGRQLEDSATTYARRQEDLDNALAKERETIAQDYQKRLLELEDNLEEQLNAAENQREEDYINLERSLERQKQLRDLERSWEEQDRLTAMAQELYQLGQHFATVEGLTYTHLARLLTGWEQYFQDLDAVYQGYLSSTDPISGVGSPWGPEGISHYGPEPVIPTAITTTHSVIPTIATQSGVTPTISGGGVDLQSRNVRVTVDGNALDPYIQSVVAREILEIEKGR